MCLELDHIPKLIDSMPNIDRAILCMVGRNIVRGKPQIRGNTVRKALALIITCVSWQHEKYVGLDVRRCDTFMRFASSYIAKASCSGGTPLARCSGILAIDPRYTTYRLIGWPEATENSHERESRKE